jgi:hypothetical protein
MGGIWAHTGNHNARAQHLFDLPFNLIFLERRVSVRATVYRTSIRDQVDGMVKLSLRWKFSWLLKDTLISLKQSLNFCRNFSSDLDRGVCHTQFCHSPNIIASETFDQFLHRNYLQSISGHIRKAYQSDCILEISKSNYVPIHKSSTTI